MKKPTSTPTSKPTTDKKRGHSPSISKNQKIFNIFYIFIYIYIYLVITIVRISSQPIKTELTNIYFYIANITKPKDEF